MTPLHTNGPAGTSEESRVLGLDPTHASAIAGGLMALAFPPFPFGLFAYVALALALVAVRGAPIRLMAWRGFVFSLVFQVSTLYWIGWVSIGGMLTMVVVLSLYVALVFACYGYIRRFLGERASWLFPVIWIAHEYLRGLGDLAFPWTNISLSQVYYLNLIQFADITGDLGVGLWVGFINVLIYKIITAWISPRRQPIGAFAATLILLFVLPFLYGWGTIQRLKSEDSVRVAVLQGDIDSFHKWDSAYVDLSFAAYETQAREAAEAGAELTVLPETAAPVYLRAEPRYHRAFRELAAETRVPLLIGTLEYEALPDGGYLRYNAAVAMDPAGYHTNYHAKLQLVPLGEWIPFSDKIKILDRLEVGGAHFTEGKKLVLFDHPKGPYAAAICFESAFPDIIRRFAHSGARFLVNITNDGWYGLSSGPTQHALIAVYRAIETRLPIARSANTGISGFIDRVGRLRHASDQYIPECLVADLALGKESQKTFFVRNGMYLGRFCTLVTGTLLILAVFVNWRRETAGKS
jgi:apolipoprotein N-acyltransferase